MKQKQKCKSPVRIDRLERVLPCGHANMRLCRFIVAWGLPHRGFSLGNETGHAVTSPLPHEMSEDDTAGKVRPRPGRVGSGRLAWFIAL